MATYIPGMTDYIPKLQPFTPDYNFYANYLGTKQQKYDQGFDQINKVYGKLLNSPLSKDENIERRDKFFKDAEETISTLAGLDLSLEQNVQTASKVFEPLYNDDYIMKDMAYTKNGLNQLGYAESLKSCFKPEDCGGQMYWEEGVNYIHHHMQDFKNASMEDSLGIQNVNYISDVNVMKEATQLAKDSGLSVEYDEVGSQYITTYKNGEALKVPLLQYFRGTLGKDQRVKDKFKVEAYNSRKNFMMASDNPEAAEIEYINEITKSYGSLLPERKKQLSEDERILSKEEKVIESGYADGSIAQEQYEAGLRGISESRAIIEENVKQNEELSEVANRFGINPSNVDQFYGNLLMDQSFQDSAAILANRDAKVTTKANPYGLKSYDFKLWKQKEAIQQGNKIDLVLIKDKLKQDAEARKKKNKEKGRVIRSSKPTISYEEAGFTGETDSKSIKANADKDYSFIAGEIEALDNAITDVNKSYVHDLYKESMNSNSPNKEAAAVRLEKLEKDHPYLVEIALEESEGERNEAFYNSIVSSLGVDGTDVLSEGIKLAGEVEDPFYGKYITQKQSLNNNKQNAQHTKREIDSQRKGLANSLKRQVPEKSTFNQGSVYEAETFNYMMDVLGKDSPNELQHYLDHPRLQHIDSDVIEEAYNSFAGGLSTTATLASQEGEGQGSFKVATKSQSLSFNDNSDTNVRGINNTFDYLESATASQDTELIINGEVIEKGDPQFGILSEIINQSRTTEDEATLNNINTKFKSISGDVDHSELELSGFDRKFIQALNKGKKIDDEGYIDQLNITVRKREDAAPSRLKQEAQFNSADRKYTSQFATASHFKRERAGQISLNPNQGVVNLDVNVVYKEYNPQTGQLEQTIINTDNIAQYSGDLILPNYDVNTTNFNMVENNINVFLEQMAKQNFMEEVKFNRAQK